MSKKLVNELEMLTNSLKSGDASNQELSIPALAERIAKTLQVKADEVAILAVSGKWRHLSFLVPQALRNVGHIPLSSTSARRAHGTGKPPGNRQQFLDGSSRQCF
jgi:hypothetical protein